MSCLTDTLYIYTCVKHFGMANIKKIKLNTQIGYTLCGSVRVRRTTVKCRAKTKGTNAGTKMLNYGQTSEITSRKDAKT